MRSQTSWQCGWNKITRLLHSTSCLLIVITVAAVAAPVTEFICLDHERGGVGNCHPHLSSPTPVQDHWESSFVADQWVPVKERPPLPWPKANLVLGEDTSWKRPRCLWRRNSKWHHWWCTFLVWISPIWALSWSTDYCNALLKSALCVVNQMVHNAVWSSGQQHA